MSPRHSIRWSLLSTIVLLLSLNHLHLLQAQPQLALVPATSPTSARHDSKFYITGGFASMNGTNTEARLQTFYLDLSIPWNASTPVYKQLAPAPFPIAFGSYGAMSRDGQSLIVLRPTASNFVSLYNVKDDKWVNSKVVDPKLSLQWLAHGQDAMTGQVYMIGPNDGANVSTLIYNYEADSLNKVDLESDAWFGITFSRSVAWPARKSILFFGGFYNFKVQDTSLMMEYTPSTGVWKELVYKNPKERPPVLADFCMAIDDNASKIVIFGGRILKPPKEGILSGDMYILDMATLTWSRGPTFSTPRIYPACTIYNSTLISWGGQDADKSTTDVILYDLNTNEYKSRYAPSYNGVLIPEPALLPPSETGKSTDETAKTKTGPIIGGAAGAVCVALAAVALFIFMRRKRKAAMTKADTYPRKGPQGSNGSNSTLGGIDGNEKDVENGSSGSVSGGGKQSEGSKKLMSWPWSRTVTGNSPSPTSSPTSSGSVTTMVDGASLRGPQLYGADHSSVVYPLPPGVYRPLDPHGVPERTQVPASPGPQFIPRKGNFREMIMEMETPTPLSPHTQPRGLHS